MYWAYNLLCLFYSIKVLKKSKINLYVHELLTVQENNNEVFPSDFLLSGAAAIHVLISQHMGYSLHMYKGKVISDKMLRDTLCIVRIIKSAYEPSGPSGRSLSWFL